MITSPSPFERLTALVKEHVPQLQINPTTWAISSLPVALDVEDNERGGFVGLGISNLREAFYFTSLTPQVCEMLERGLFIGQNAVTDLDKLRAWGVKVKDDQLIWDTQLIAHILDSSQRQYALDELAARELDIQYPNYEAVCGPEDARITLDKLPIEVGAYKNAMDCFCTFKLYLKQKSWDFGGIAKRYYDELASPVSKIFYKMEQRGIRIDRSYLQPLQIQLEQNKALLLPELQKNFGDINFRSPVQVLEAFHRIGVYPVWRRKPSTDKRALEPYRQRLDIQQYLEYKQCTTLISNYVKKYLAYETDVVHPHFHQTGTRTGRPSCSNPNLLQIPKRTKNGRLVRKMFVAREGMKFGSFDYGQIEPRLMAHISKDLALCDLFNKGVDFHDYTRDRVKRLEGNRDKAKVLNLSVGYRATSKSVSYQLQCDESEAQSTIEDWWDLFPDLQNWQDKLIWEVARLGYVTTLFGRRIKIDNLDHPREWKQAAAARQLINNLVQASAAEVMQYGMLAVDAAEIQILVQVYDELLVEMPIAQAEEIAVQTGKLLKTCVNLDVPLTVDAGIGANWAELEKRKV